jgi:hypothetical protein
MRGSLLQCSYVSLGSCVTSAVGTTVRNCTGDENLDGDVKGKGTSGSNREAESTDALPRGGLLRTSEEAGVMPVERREQAIAFGSVNRQREEPGLQWKAAAFARWHEPYESRGSRTDL